MKLREIGDRLGCRLEGDGDIEIHRVAGIEDAGAGDLTFFSNPKYAWALKRTAASAVIAGDQAEGAPCAVLRARHPYLSFAKAVELFADPWRPAPGVHRLADVAASATIGEGASIGAFAVVGDGARIGARTIVHPHVTIGRDAQVGDDCVIHSRVSIRERVQIGNRVVLQDGAVVGSDGFGFARTPEGAHYKIPQIGRVLIDDDVEVGANATIDRPAVGATRIGAGTKIDNLVQIAHGVTIGRDVLLAAQVGIAGSTTIEDRVTLAGQVGVSGHHTIGRGATLAAQAGVFGDIPAGATWSGYPARPHKEALRAQAALFKLPPLLRRIERLLEDKGETT